MIARYCWISLTVDYSQGMVWKSEVVTFSHSPFLAPASSIPLFIPLTECCPSSRSVASRNIGKIRCLQHRIETARRRLPSPLLPIHVPLFHVLRRTSLLRRAFVGPKLINPIDYSFHFCEFGLIRNFFYPFLCGTRIKASGFREHPESVNVNTTGLAFRLALVEVIRRSRKSIRLISVQLHGILQNS